MDSYIEILEMEDFSVFDNLNEQVVIIDKDFRILYANEAYIRENGYKSREEVIGQPCYRISHKRETPCEGECHPCPLKEIEKSGGAINVVHTHYTHDNRETPVEICAFPMRNGKILQIIKNIKNDKEKFYLFSLAQKLSSIGFLALGIAHQINTPLSSISLALEELAKKVGETEEIQIIRNSVKTCKDIVDKLLLFSPKKSGEDLIDLERAVKDVVDLVKVYAKEKGVKLKTKTEKVYILGNEADIRHVLLNLIINAIQASDEGKKVFIELSTEGNKVKISVKDEGKGIPSHEIDKIFMPFYTGSNKKEGTGLGLAIVNEIVKSYKGEIKVKSVLGKGSVFEVYLPLP